MRWWDKIFCSWEDKTLTITGTSLQVPKHCHKRLVPKIACHFEWERFVRMSLRDRLVCFADFVGITVLACLPYAKSFPPIVPFCFLPTLLNCFLRACLPTPFAAALKYFLPLTTYATSGAANSNK